MGTVLTQFTVDGVALWVVLLICGGVFLESFMDACLLYTSDAADDV